MGLLKRIIIMASVLFLFAGCSSSVIKIAGSTEKADVHPMFGKVPSREFYTNYKMTDSLRLLWEGEANGSFTQSSVSYYDKYIFVNDLSGRIFCFDMNSGKIVGQLKHKGPVYTTPVIHRYSIIYAESVVDEDKSILRIYNFLEGKAIAEKEIAGRVLTEILLLDREIFFVTEKGLLYKFGVIGEYFWVKDLKSLMHSSPVSDGEHIYLADDNGDIISVSRNDGEINFRKNLGISFTSGLTLTDESIIAGDKEGFVYSINKNNGKVNWKYSSGSKITAVPVFSGEMLYIVNLGGAIISLDTRTGKERWRTKTSGVLNSTPLLTDKYLVIPDLSNRIIVIDIKNGDEVKVLTLPSRAKLSPVINKNILIIGYDRGMLRAYEII